MDLRENLRRIQNVHDRVAGFGFTFGDAWKDEFGREYDGFTQEKNSYLAR